MKRKKKKTTMKLSNNFILSEFNKTSTGLTNNPTPEAIASIKELVENVLQPARDLIDMPIGVYSGYRSKLVNRRVNGAPNSQHMKGEAADIHCADNARLFEIIRENIVFDQLIWEFGNNDQPQWIHVSYKSQGNRNEILKAFKENGKTKYIRI